MKITKLNTTGITHILVPLIVIIAIAGIGTYLISRGNAYTTSPKNVLILGDSIPAGFGTLQNPYAQTKVMAPTWRNYAVTGSQHDAQLGYLQKAISRELASNSKWAPSVAFIMVGADDIGTNTYIPGTGTGNGGSLRLLNLCVQNRTCPLPTADKQRKFVSDLGDAYVSLYKELNSPVLVANNGGKQIPLVIVAYPYEFPASGSINLRASNTTLSSGTVKSMHDGFVLLDNMLDKAVTQAQSEVGRTGVKYYAPTNLLAGHLLGSPHPYIYSDRLFISHLSIDGLVLLFNNVNQAFSLGASPIETIPNIQASGKL